MVGRSNNDPKVIGRYYLDAVTNHGGFPVFMRGDMGTEKFTHCGNAEFIF